MLYTYSFTAGVLAIFRIACACLERVSVIDVVAPAFAVIVLLFPMPSGRSIHPLIGVLAREAIFAPVMNCRVVVSTRLRVGLEVALFGLHVLLLGRDRCFDDCHSWLVAVVV